MTYSGSSCEKVNVQKEILKLDQGNNNHVQCLKHVQFTLLPPSLRPNNVVNIGKMCSDFSGITLNR